jgi:hypothetical protein
MSAQEEDAILREALSLVRGLPGGLSTREREARVLAACPRARSLAAAYPVFFGGLVCGAPGPGAFRADEMVLWMFARRGGADSPQRLEATRELSVRLAGLLPPALRSMPDEMPASPLAQL